jgi:hypothetical protein
VAISKRLLSPLLVKKLMERPSNILVDEAEHFGKAAGLGNAGRRN